MAGIFAGVASAAFGDVPLVGCAGTLARAVGHLFSLVELAALANARTNDRLAGWLAAYWFLGIPCALLVMGILGRLSA